MAGSATATLPGPTTGTEVSGRRAGSFATKPGRTRRAESTGKPRAAKRSFAATPMSSTSIEL